MKVCPQCNKTYADDNLNFCLEDGTVLTQSGSSMPETVLMNQARLTEPQAMPNTHPTQPAGWSQAPQYAAAPKRSSKAWLWVVGILGVVVLLCGGGFAALALIGMNMETNTAADNTSRPLTNRTTTTTSPSPASDDRMDAEVVDLSGWVKEFSAYGTTEFTNGEFIMSSKQKGFYYVLVAPDDYTTTAANTRVTVRNVDDAASTLGYGLIFHSNPSPLTQDYALLIDTKRKRYRVVRHEPQKETSLISWTNSAAIKDGGQENVLEVRDKGEISELYINGQMVNTVKNNYAYKNGVPGLYSGDAVKIGFKNLEIRK
jgi:hypothetical protein